MYIHLYPKTTGYTYVHSLHTYTRSHTCLYTYTHKLVQKLPWLGAGGCHVRALARNCLSFCGHPHLFQVIESHKQPEMAQHISEHTSPKLSVVSFAGSIRNKVFWSLFRIVFGWRQPLFRSWVFRASLKWVCEVDLKRECKRLWKWLRTQQLLRKPF